MSQIQPRRATVVIYQGDDLARLDDLDTAVERQQRAADAAAKATGAPRTLGDPGPSSTALAEAQKARDTFAADAELRGVRVVLQAVPRRTWRQLMRDHGPRPDVSDDEVFGVNMDDFPDALLPLSVVAADSTIEGDVAEFLDSLSDYDYYDRLFVQAFALNRGAAVADPTQRLLSASSQTSAATSS